MIVSFNMTNLQLAKGLKKCVSFGCHSYGVFPYGLQMSHFYIFWGCFNNIKYCPLLSTMIPFTSQFTFHYFTICCWITMINHNHICIYIHIYRFLLSGYSYIFLLVLSREWMGSWGLLGLLLIAIVDHSLPY